MKRVALLISFIALAAGCAESVNGLDDCDEKCDGLGNFDTVDLDVLDGPPTYLCETLDMHPDCTAVLPVVGQAAELGPFPVTVAIKRTELGAGAYERVIKIRATDVRILTHAKRPIRLSGVYATNGLGSYRTEAALSVDLREDGALDWVNTENSVSGWEPDLTGRKVSYHEDTVFWHDISLTPTTGKAKGTGRYCTDEVRENDINIAFCSSLAGSLSTNKIPGDSWAEYRVRPLPIWQFEDFDGGDYSIGFTFD